MLLTRSAQGNALVKSYVIPYYGCFSYDNSIPVINEKPFSDLCSRMYFDSRFAHAPLGDPPGQEKMTGSIQSVREAVMKHRLKTGIEKYLHGSMDGRIPFPDNPDFFFYISDYAHFASFFPIGLTEDTNLLVFTYSLLLLT